MKQNNTFLTYGQLHRLSLAQLFATAIWLAFVLPSNAMPLQETGYSGCGGIDAPMVNAAYEARVVELVNHERTINGDLPPLKRVDALDQAARYHATDLGADNYFNHDSYDRNGDTLTFACGAFERIGRWYTDWSRAGENIGAGYATPEDIVAGWMNGDGHRRNILNPNFTEVGVGYYQGAGLYPSYWVQDFGMRQGVHHIVINGEAAVTEDRTVELYIHGSWSEMRLRNDDGPWESWQPFANKFMWTLDPGAGEHVVHAEMRTITSSSQASDTIHLNAATTISPTGNLRVFLPAIVTDPSASRSAAQGKALAAVTSDSP